MQLLSDNAKGSLYAIGSGFLYGFVGYFGVSAMHTHLSAANMLFWRFLVSALFMLPILFIQRESLPRIHIRQVWQSYLSGLLFYAGSTLLYFIATPYIGSGLAMVVFFVYPAVVMLINTVLYKTAITRQYIIAISVILMGLFLLVDKNAFSFDLYGITLSIFSAILYAGYIISSKNNHLHASVSTLVISLGCMTTSFCVALLEGTFFFPTQFEPWLNILGIGIIATAIPVLLLLKGLEYISSEKGSILSVLEPVFVMIFGALLLHESISLIQLVGVLVVLSGALLTLVKS